MVTKFGQLDLSNRLQKNIEECKNGKPEPRVYRLDIKQVVELFKEKEIVRVKHLETVEQLINIE